MAQISPAPFTDNFVLNGLNSPQKTQMVYDLSGGYNVLMTLTDIINKQKSTEVVALDAKYEKPVLGKSGITAQIASTAQAGLNLTVNFSDPTFQLFRVGNNIFDVSRNQGRVVSTAPGTLVIEPTAKTATLTTGTQFVAGGLAKDGWDVSVNRGSTGKTSLFENPAYDYNYTSIMRDSQTLFRRDMVSSYPMFKGKYWYTAQDEMMVRRWARGYEYKSWFSWRGQAAASGGGTKNENGGLEWAIKNRGGVVATLANNPTKLDFENFIMDVKNRQTSGNVELTLLMGSGALRNIQTNFTQNFIQYAGNTNTFGGVSVQGLDVKKYNIAGVSCNFIECPLFNDEQIFPEASTIGGVIGTKMSNTIVAIDQSAYPVIGGGMAPAIEKIHFGSKEIIYGYTPGIIGVDGSNPSNIEQSGYLFSAGDKDSYTLNIYSDCGIDVVARNMGWLELAS